jgi:tetrahydromethanopterin:alpha-L-glutamate ligase
MNKIGIIITDPKDWTSMALISAAKESGFFPIALDFRAAEARINTEITLRAGNIRFSDLDAVLVRDMGAGTAEGVSFRFDLLRELEAEGIPVVNSPKAIQNAANKYHASYLLAKAGLSVPETIAVQSVETGMRVISRFGDAVIKPVFGYKGKDIVRVKAGEVLFSDKPSRSAPPEPLEKTLERLLEERGMLYIQEFIPNPGRDIRAFVVGGKAIGAIYRKAAPGSWVNNLSQGGSADRCTLTEEQRNIAEKATEAIGAGFAGVDIIEGSIEKRGDKSLKTGPKILEINGTPSGKGIFDAWGINPAEQIIKYIRNIL